MEINCYSKRSQTDYKTVIHLIIALGSTLNLDWGTTYLSFDLKGCNTLSAPQRSKTTESNDLEGGGNMRACTVTA